MGMHDGWRDLRQNSPQGLGRRPIEQVEKMPKKPGAQAMTRQIGIGKNLGHFQEPLFRLPRARAEGAARPIPSANRPGDRRRPAQADHGHGTTAPPQPPKNWGGGGVAEAFR